MRRTLLLGLATLASCHSPQTHQMLVNGEEPAVANSDAPPTPTATGGAIEEKDELLSSSLKWPAEVGAIPSLLASVKAAFAKEKAELVEAARDDRAMRAKDQSEFHPYEQSLDLTTAGQSPALLSVSSAWYSYSGGAHPNHGTHALLWDRAAAKEIKPAALFDRPASRDALLKARFCAALDAERKKRRGNEEDGGSFNDCPTLDDIALIVTDKDGDGRFETLLLHADPYVAGPYAEGDYDIELPVTAAFIAALKAPYRASFAAKR